MLNAALQAAFVLVNDAAATGRRGAQRNAATGLRVRRASRWWVRVQSLSNMIATSACGVACDRSFAKLEDAGACPDVPG